MFPTKYEIKANDAHAIMTGTIAKPSSPSVKLTALELPTMTKIPKVNKKFLNQ